MRPDLKLVAVDVDGTFVRSDYTYDVPRFRRILARMEAAGCRFVVASGNQYYQLRYLFPDCAEKLAFVAENGALVKDREELVFAASIPRQMVDFVIDVCRGVPRSEKRAVRAAQHLLPAGHGEPGLFRPDPHLLPPPAVGG